MATKVFERRKKEDRPVLAICYDFDKTLSPDDMQAQGYIQSVGYDVGEFWKEVNVLAEQNEMDQNLAYMLKMVREAEGNIVFSRKTLADYGSRVTLFPGVEDWFSRIREYGAGKGVRVEHYIISSGLKEMIEGTRVAGEFERIYASSFYYNERGLAVWPAQVINYTNKTQFLFRIEKGVLDVNDSAVNDSFAPEELRVPFRNMVYIGDSDTDVPCMKLVNSNGGHSIGVYHTETKDKTKVHKMMRDKRIKYFAPADYREGEELDVLVKAIIDRTATNEVLESQHYSCKSATAAAESNIGADEQRRSDLIMALEDSHSFAQTHKIIAELAEVKEWTLDEKEALFTAALGNSQVHYILGDGDVKAFFASLLCDAKISDAALEIKAEIEKE